MTNINKMKLLARIMLIASIATMIFGLYLIIHSSIEISELVREGHAVREKIAPLVTEIAEGLVFAVHYFFVTKFFLHSLKHGVPFTHEGAKEIKILGLETIFLPILAWIVSCIAHAGIKSPVEILEISVYEMVLGFALILVSYIMEYGTEKIERGHRGHQAIRYIKEHYPDIIDETKAALLADGTVTEEELASADKWYEDNKNKK